MYRTLKIKYKIKYTSDKVEGKYGNFMFLYLIYQIENRRIRKQVSNLYNKR